MKKQVIKEGDHVCIKSQYAVYYSNRVMNSVGVVEKCVKVENPTYTRYFYVVHFDGIDHKYHIPSGVLQIIRTPKDMNPNKDTQSTISDQLLSNLNRALDEAAVRIKARAELRAKAEQERQKNSFTICVPYTRAFSVAENADAVRAKIRTVHNLLLAGQSISPAQIQAIADNFEECQKMIYEIASCATQNAH